MFAAREAAEALEEESAMTMSNEQPQIRRRPRLRTVHVKKLEHISPHVMSVTVAGPDLEGFGPPSPGQHVKVFLPTDGQPHALLPIPGPEGPQFPPDQDRKSTRLNSSH